MGHNRKIYEAPTAELLYLAPQESVASSWQKPEGTNWIWSYSSFNFWGTSPRDTSSVIGWFYDFGIDETD